MGTLIYAKQYPEKECSREYQKISPEGELWAETTLMEVPGWKEKRERFIRRAIEVSEQYRYDVKIVEQDHTIVVELSLDFPVMTQGWMDLLRMSDYLYVFRRKENEILPCI